MNRQSLVAIVILAIIASVHSASLETKADIYATTDPLPQPGQSWMDKHNSFVDKIKSTNGEIPVIFWGDSLTAGWTGSGNDVFQEKYAPLGTSNFGIGGDKTQHLLWRLLNAEADPILTTKVAVVMIGGNNWKDVGITTEKVFQGIEANVQVIRDNMPNTKILLLAMIPAIDNLVAGTLIKDINRKVATLHNGNSIQFLNMYDTFLLNDGTINWSLYNSDRVHLVKDGYVNWATNMDPLLRHMLNQ